MAPHPHTMGSLMVLERAFIVVVKYRKFHVHLNKVQALPSIRQLDQLNQVPPTGNIMKRNNSWVSILTCQGVLIIVEPLLVCTNGDCDLLQRHSYSLISDWWHRVYIEIWGPAIYHACPTVSITHKDFTRCQIALHNPSVKLEIQCAFIHPFTNKLHLRYWLPLKHISCDNILQFVTYVVQRMGMFCKLIQYIILILSSISSPCIIPSLCFESLSFSLLSCCFSG